MIQKTWNRGRGVRVGRIACLCFFAAALCGRVGRADVYRWYDGERIPGTEALTPGPNWVVDSWNNEERNLRFASLGNRDLRDSRITNSWLDQANFFGSDLRNSIIEGVSLTKGTFRESKLNGVSFVNSDLSGADLIAVDLSSTNLTNAVIRGAQLAGTVRLGLTREQLESTASYQTKDLSDTVLSFNDLSGWDFRQQNMSRVKLEETDLRRATFEGANLSHAVIRSPLDGVDFAHANIFGASISSSQGVHLSPAQLSSTASFQSKDLREVTLVSSDTTGWDLRAQDVRGASLDLHWTNAWLDGARIESTQFVSATKNGLTEAQFATTASHQAGQLKGIGLEASQLDHWNFLGQDLTGASFQYSSLVNTDFTNARINDVNFSEASGMTHAQLAATASYKANDLSGIRLDRLNLESTDFHGQQLSNASFFATQLNGADFSSSQLLKSDFTQARLLNANFARANLTSANLSATDLSFADLSDTDLTDTRLDYASLEATRFDNAVLRGTNMAGTTSRGFSLQQLQSTASYQSRVVQGVSWDDCNLGGFDFSGLDLTGSTFRRASLPILDNSIIAGVNFSGATLRYNELASTASFQARDLSDIVLSGVQMSGWDLSGLNLKGANFENANLFSAKLQDSDLRLANLASLLLGADLSGADLRNANLRPVILDSTIFSPATIYSQWTVFPVGFDPVQQGLSFRPVADGDYNANDQWDVADLDLLQERIHFYSHKLWLPNSAFDLDQSGRLNGDDVTYWVHQLKKTTFGDANVDGRFDSSDLIQVFAAGLYEKQALRSLVDGSLVEAIASWPTGDWNSDGEFTTSDLLVAFQEGSYETGPRPAVKTVPEPTEWSLWISSALCAACATARLRRR